MPQYSSFAKPHVDLRKKADMVQFLAAHNRYGEYLRSGQYAHNVRVRNLNIPRELIDAAYQAVDTESAYININELTQRWQLEHPGYAAYFEGRSGGQFVLSGLPADESHDQLKQMSMEDLRFRVRLVQSFDTLTDECVTEFMGFARWLSEDESELESEDA